jgi:hypothetical protein
MAETLPELLQVALVDLREARRLAHQRLPAVTAATADADTRAAFAALAARSGAEEGALAGLLDEPHGDPNLWAAGILDDADRDAATDAAGAVLDVALVGAVRKLLAADIVSLETAIALARVHAPGQAPPLERMHADALACDAVLRARLSALVAR